MQKKMGRPSMAEKDKRIKQNMYFNPQTRELAQRILACKLSHFQAVSSNGRPGFGHVVDEAVKKWADELGIEVEGP